MYGHVKTCVKDAVWVWLDDGQTVWVMKSQFSQHGLIPIKGLRVQVGEPINGFSDLVAVQTCTWVRVANLDYVI